MKKPIAGISITAFDTMHGIITKERFLVELDMCYPEGEPELVSLAIAEAIIKKPTLLPVIEKAIEIYHNNNNNHENA